MSELVGGAFLSAFLEALFDKLASEEVVNFFHRKTCVVKLLDELNTVLLSANVLLNDAEEKQIKDQEVQKWLVKLKEVIYDADDLVDEINTEALRCKLEGESRSGTCKVLMKLIPTLFTTFDNTVESEITGILGRLNIIMDQKYALGLKEHAPSNPLHRQYAPLVEESCVYGRNGDKEVLTKLLLSNDSSSNKISVIPIVGMGGIGKTTLAQLIYNDDRIEKHFELKAWVTVSENFDVFRVTKIIFESVTSQKCDFEDLFQLQLKLKEALKGKKFLFIHDDVWNENYPLWDVLKSSFDSGAQGSMIIVTTRSRAVASIMATGPIRCLAEISHEDCWRLFAKHAFNNDVEMDEYPNLQVIGKEIVKMCKGLPLAVKSLGGLLRSERDPNKWVNKMTSDIWELYGKGCYVFPSLWLSYHHLPAHLKPCFAYCSIFPKNFEFEKEKIILLWMAEGFLHPNTKGKRMEEVGEEYFLDLLSRSLFQRSSQDNSATLIMHDLVHDLATFVSQEFCFRWEYGTNLHNLTSKTRHVSYRKGFYHSSEYEGLSKATRLRTFVALPLTSYRYTNCLVPHELLLTAGRCLRVLSLCQSSFEELPNSISSLKHLRYLDLSYMPLKEISNSLCTLYNLQTLLLSYCKKLTQLPSNMGYLINLRHLDITEVPLKKMPLQMCNMKDLQTLPQIVFSNEYSGFRFKDLEDLKHLSGKVSISGLENVVDVKDVSKANLRDKKFLTVLNLRWNGGADNSQKEREVLDALQPHINLKELNIQSFRGTRFSDWVGNHMFSNIVSICLEDCKNCCFLPPLGQLSSLKYLVITGFDSVVTIGDEFYCSGTSFRSLEYLWFSNMCELKEWSFIGGTQEGGVFPRLKIICLVYCPKLMVVLPCYLPSLSQLCIRKCKQTVALLPRAQQTDISFAYLESISISDCPQLESLLEWESHSNLKELCLFGCKKLFQNHMHWNLQRLSSLRSLNIWGWEDESFPDETLLPNTLTSLYIQSCRNLKVLNGKAFHHLASLEELHIRYCDKLYCLPEEGLSPSLSRLSINGCPLLDQRCQREGADWPKIVSIPSVLVNDRYI